MKDLLTKSSNPSRVPVNSRSFFITTHMREPMHLSMSSATPASWSGVMANEELEQGYYLGARFGKPFKTLRIRNAMPMRAASRVAPPGPALGALASYSESRQRGYARSDCSNQKYIVFSLASTVPYPTQHEISMMLEMSSNHENGMKI